ncbi:squalene/phytoene synthase family protein [Streptomyces sp. NPDC005438]|uniref:phytoene/squalene synthase family protein n=1 Tax=Streptomyces sp. NPDC005438 TaxID=3156880 RepID=UPI0033BE4BDA
MARRIPSTPRLPRPVRAAYEHCAAVTAQQAPDLRYGVRLLPTAKRRALCSLYAFHRRVDDIAAAPLRADHKRARLRAAAQLVVDLGQGRVDSRHPDPVAVALGHAVGRYRLSHEPLEELVDAARDDLDRAGYQDWDQLGEYCRRRTGALGRLAVEVLGTRPGARDEPRAGEYVDALCTAVHLTHILRDLGRDAVHGRIALPRDEVERFGCAHALWSGSGSSDADLAGLVGYQVERARSLFAQGYALFPLLDRRGGACVAAVAGIHRRLLERIAARPTAVLRRQLDVPAPHKTLITLRGLAGHRPRQLAPHWGQD